MSVAPIEPILTVPRLCLLLACSRATFYEWKAAGRFGRDLPPLIPIVPALDSKPRYRGDVFASWLDEREQAGRLRRDLRMVK